MSPPSDRAWPGRLLRLGLLLVPLLLYWSGITPRYGWRDDYSTLREAREEPGKIFAVNASHGRPVYGFLLERSFAALRGIDDLRWARVASALGLGLCAALAAWVLEVQLRWSRAAALLTAAWLVALPAAQIFTHWAICWPISLAAVLGVAAFAVTEAGAGADRKRRRVFTATGGFALLLLALLTYQPNALLYVVLLAAGWVAQADAPGGARLRRAARHGAILVLALGAAFVVSQALFVFELAPRSPRFAVETAWFDKLGWFVRLPLRNALSLGILADAGGRTEPAHTWMAGLVAALLLGFGVFEWRRRGVTAAVAWWAGFLACAALAYAVSFVAAERWASYRTIFALTGVVVVFLVHAAGQVVRRPVAATAVLGLLVALQAALARHDSRTLIVETQIADLQRLERAARGFDPARSASVMAWLPQQRDAGAPVRYLDEFGALSTDNDWCAKEMLMLVLHERFPADPALVDRVQFTSSYTAAAPAPGTALLDLRVAR